MVGLGVDLADMPDYVANNCLGTAVLLKAMAARRFSGRIVLASSMVVYGEGRYLCLEHGVVAPAPRAAERLERGEFEPACPQCDQPLIAEAVPESAPADPRNVYAASKLHQEHLCQVYARETGASAIALRYHNVYGPRMPRDTPYAGVASIFRSALEAGRAPQVFEDGDQMRDFVAVADVAVANKLALEAPLDGGGAFNVASGTPRSVGEMAAELARAMHGRRTRGHRRLPPRRRAPRLCLGRQGPRRARLRRRVRVQRGRRRVRDGAASRPGSRASPRSRSSSAVALGTRAR